jgi:hypothetical protein
VVIGIKTDRGPWVGALIAADYTVYASTSEWAVQEQRAAYGTHRSAAAWARHP